MVIRASQQVLILVYYTFFQCLILVLSLLATSGIKAAEKMQTPKALLQGKCPRCHKGEIFKYPLAGHLLQFNQMNTACPHCEVRLEPEPGFYQGAMYVGYGFTMLCIILTSAVLYAVGYYSEWVYIDRKSTRLNSSHSQISYAVFCLKKKRTRIK